MIGIVHVTEELLRPLVERYGQPARLDWDGEVTEPEYRLATYNPRRRHDVTLFILDEGDRIALIRKPHFAEGIWRPPGGGIALGEKVAAGAVREAFEETGLRVEIERYLVDAHATFRWDGKELAWRTHVLLARTGDTGLAPQDSVEIAGARWGTIAELAGPLRDRLLSTGRALWRYRVALHDAALSAYSSSG
jgi:ADP-ribose pyrophosphatase YjhB (NUDIX family)